MAITPASPTVARPAPFAALEREPTPLEPLDPQITSIQPGGGVCMALELAWGHVRRAILKRLFPRYVARMAACRIGEPGGVPVEVLDPRDLKFYRNQTGCHWRTADDPFTWRDRLPIVREGLAEAILLTTFWLLVAMTIATVSLWIAALPLGLAILSLAFFRNPRRTSPTDLGAVVAPADGRIVSVCPIEHEPFLGGPAIKIGIFLSIFDVHVNRMPVAGRTIGLTYRPGKFLNAILPAAARENERLIIRLESTEWPNRRFIVTQIAGLIARRIVCRLKPGDVLLRGEVLGLIKLGSRTEIIVPDDPCLKLLAAVGQRVRAGETILARYDDPRTDDSNSGPTDGEAAP